MIGDHINAVANEFFLPLEGDFKCGNSLHLEYRVVVLGCYDFLGHKSCRSAGLPIKSLSIDSTIPDADASNITHISSSLDGSMGCNIGTLHASALILSTHT